MVHVRTYIHSAIFNWDNIILSNVFGVSVCWNTSGLCCAALFLLQVREERFRATSESTNVRVLWWSLGQTIILLVIGVWQMRHLKSFFEAKKIV